jgi:hypothetical protein
MEWWMWIAGYLATGLPVGLITSRMSFKDDAADPKAHLTYTTGEGYNSVEHTRTELERLEECAASGVRWGWAGGIFWPMVTLAFIVSCLSKSGKNLAGGKELARARQEALTAETLKKAEEITKSIEKDWRTQYGPDAP